MNSPFFRLLYSAWCVFLFGLLIVLTFPLVWLGLRRRAWYGLAHRATRLIGQGFFIGALLPVRIEHRFRPDPKQPYIYCANHFSYMDITLLGTIVPGMYAFIGKTDVQKVPLFGYMFSRLHVMVDRNDANSRARSLKQSLQLLREGRPIIVFPEGGMRSTNPPQMASFMDGAFAMAIQQQVPIVPITLLNDYRVLPNAKKLRMRWEPIQVVFHEPIPTIGLIMNDVEMLKQKTFGVIETELSGAGGNPRDAATPPYTKKSGFSPALHP